MSLPLSSCLPSSRRALIALVSVALVSVFMSPVVQNASAGLPEGWHYELMTAGDTLGAPVDQAFNSSFHNISPDGDHGQVLTPKAFEGGVVSAATNIFGMKRGPFGWSWHGLQPAAPIGTALPVSYNAWDSDADYRVQVYTSPVSYDPDDPAETVDVYVGDASGATWVSQPRVGSAEAAYSGMSADASHLLFRTADKILPVDAGRVSGMGLYDRTSGQTLPVAVDDSGDLLNPCGALIAGGGFSQEGAPNGMNPVSDDGSRIFFTTGVSASEPGCSVQADGAGQIYARIDHEKTVLVSPSRRTVPDPLRQQPVFRAATPDGSRVFFTSSEPLTDAEPDGVSGTRLYRFDLPTAGDPQGTLTDLTPVAVDSNGQPTTADPGLPTTTNSDGVVGLSDDGDRVYFVATGQLTADATAPGVKLYVSDHGEVRFIAAAALSTFLTDPSVRVSPDGSNVAFLTATNQPGYSHGSTQQIYAYDIGTTAAPVCVSCPAVATGSARFGFQMYPTISTRMRRWNVSDGGRVAFDTPDPLVPGDSNGQLDTYMFEPGSGVQLISSGRSPVPSPLVGASRDGTSIAFETYDTLVPQDVDNGVGDMYVARLGPDFPYAPPVPECSGDACQGDSARAPQGPAATSATFGGRGDVRSPRAVRARVLGSRKTVGRALRLRVRVGAAGVIRVAGVGVRSRPLRARTAGTYRVRVVLRRQARRRLARRGTVRSIVRVRFTPREGSPSATRARLTFKRPARTGR